MWARFYCSNMFWASYLIEFWYVSIRYWVKIRTNMLDTEATSIERLEFCQDNIILKHHSSKCHSLSLLLIQLSLCHRRFKTHSFGKAKKEKEKKEAKKLMNEFTHFLMVCFFLLLFLWFLHQRSHFIIVQDNYFVIKITFSMKLKVK